MPYTVMLSAAKHLYAERDRPFAALSMTVLSACRAIASTDDEGHFLGLMPIGGPSWSPAVGRQETLVR
jgi:hypothetical protein